jgi:outer membrane immunogenic protein
MKKAFLAASALALMAGSALAADLPSYKAPPPPPPPPLITWTGLYGGLNFGVGFYANNSSNAWGAGFNNHGGSRAGVVGGGQIGYNYQITPMFLVGVETDFQGTSIGSGAGGNTFNWFFGLPPVTTATLNWFGTVRGRAGLTLLNSKVLIYGTGGFAYGEVQRNGWWNQNSAVQTGWTVGGGGEWMVIPNWSLKLEYLYTQISGNGNNNGGWFFNPGWGLNSTNNRTRFHTIRAGVNYHFNFGAPAPVLAKY